MPSRGSDASTATQAHQAGPRVGREACSPTPAGEGAQQGVFLQATIPCSPCRFRPLTTQDPAEAATASAHTLFSLTPCRLFRRLPHVLDIAGQVGVVLAHHAGVYMPHQLSDVGDADA